MTDHGQVPPVHVRAMEKTDWPRVAAIYRQGIETGLATFETQVPDWDAWDRNHGPACRLVAVSNPGASPEATAGSEARASSQGTVNAQGTAKSEGARDPEVTPGPEVVGWAALSPVSARPVYAGVAEVSVYVAPDWWGQGVGGCLMDRLVACSEEEGFWTLQAGVFPENEASLRLHEGAGFRRVGTRKKLARLHGQWRDMLLLERRSPAVL